MIQKAKIPLVKFYWALEKSNGTPYWQEGQMTLLEQYAMVEEGEEIRDVLDAFDAGEIDLDEHELAYWEHKRGEFLKKYYRAFFPKNVVPFV